MSKLIRETIVVFQHSIDTDRYPKLKTMSEKEIQVFLNKAVFELYELDVKEKQLNKNGTHSTIKIVRD